jgi:VIT1/CCC1 family predicted Fe2+/Mn2+ transporter
MMHNSLFLNRLVILTQEGRIAYDEKFHRGVNIIRGDNSSGKSTISHFIFYVLGGAFGLAPY